MSRIYIDINGVRRENYNLPAVEGRLEQVKRDTKRVRHQIPGEIAGRYEIGERLNYIYRELARLEEQIRELYEVTNACAEQYEQMERENSSNAERFD